MCGIIGVYHKPGTPKEMMGALGLELLAPIQNRGKESAGSSVATGSDIKTQKGFGTVFQAISTYTARQLDGISAILQVRYSNTGSKISKEQRMSLRDPESIEATKHARDCQPIWFTSRGKKFSLTHNGNLLNTVQRRKELQEVGYSFKSKVDTEVLAFDLAYNFDQGIEIHEAIRNVMSTCIGSYSCILLCEDGTLYAWRDAYGFWPLILAETEDLYLLGSEDTAWHKIQGRSIRNVKRSEVIMINQSGVHSFGQSLNLPNAARCPFDRTYQQSPEATLFSDESKAAGFQTVGSFRKQQGMRVYKELRDIMQPGIAIPLMASGYHYAQGFLFEHQLDFPRYSFLEIVYEKNEQVGRAFQETSKEERHKTINGKYFDQWEMAREKVYHIHREHGKVVLYCIDDSRVRGDTSDKITLRMRRDLEKHFPDIHTDFEIVWIICSPPIKFPCFYGIDTPTKNELVASTKSVEQMSEESEADAIYYLSFEGYIEEFGPLKDHYCTACFTGNYPIDPKQYGLL